MGIESARLDRGSNSGVFSVGPDQLPSLNVGDKISSFTAPGEYPAVIDTKGVLTDGVFYNGLPDDFVA